MASEKIYFVQTGGTIDKDYPQNDDNHGYEFRIGRPAVESVLRRGQVKVGYEIVTAMQKDSLDITEDDRVHLVQFVDELPSSKIIITHGTDTIHETARALLRLQGKTIILTGAMLPEKFYDSDADFNVGMAIGCLLGADEGVYIVLNGEMVEVNED